MRAPAQHPKRSPARPEGSVRTSVRSSVRTSVRTCVGCRQPAPRRELVRLVLIDGRPAVDTRRRLPGRGASIHPSAACVAQAVKRGAFARAFRAAIAGSWAADFADDFTRQVQAAFVTRGATVGLEPGNRNHS